MNPYWRARMQARPEKKSIRTRSFATWSVLALVAALALGSWGNLSGAKVFTDLEAVLEPLGALWLAALQMALLPLITSQLLAAITNTGSAAGVGRLGLRALVLFVIMLAAAGLLTCLLAPPIVALYKIDAQTVASLRTTTDVPEVARQAQTPTRDWQSLPNNLIESARKGEILPILIFTALFGAAITRLPASRREPLAHLARSAAEAMLTLVRWILIGTPVGVFAYAYSPALHAGAGTAGMLGAFIVLVCVLMIFFTIALYPVSAVLGRTSMKTFARAVAPAQLVAISTQSSIASLPALVQGGLDHLRLPLPFTGFVLPLTVSIFKLNRTISSFAKVFFLAHVYGVPLSFETLATFMVTVILLSFGTVGLPNGGVAFTTLPAYLAIGLPIEGIIVMEATTTIPDIFKTLLNVTADMSAATILSRSSRTSAAAVIEDAAAIPEGAG